MTDNKTLFIVDDEQDILHFLNIWFTKKGYNVNTFDNPKDMMDELHKHKPDLILLDVNLNGEDGREVCKEVKGEFDGLLPVILFSANTSVENNYRQCQANAFVSKPFSLQHLYNVVSSHITD